MRVVCIEDGEPANWDMNYPENESESFIMRRSDEEIVICGAKQSRDLIRSGEETAQVSAVFGELSEHAAAALEELGVSDIVLSPELTLARVRDIGGESEAIVYGRLPLMITRNCPIKNGISCNDCKKDGKLTDRKNIQFSVSCADGISTVYNSLPLWLADRASEFSADAMVLYFTNESAERVSEVVKLFLKYKVIIIMYA